MNKTLSWQAPAPTDLVKRRLYRQPTQAEISFGHGCLHWHDEIELEYRRRFVTIDGVRWTVERAN